MASALVKKLMPLAAAHARNASTLRKVCVIGAAGGIGQPLGLLMKMVRGVWHSLQWPGLLTR